MAFTYKMIHEVNSDFIYLTKELDEELASKNGEKQNQYDAFNKLEGIKDIIIVYDEIKPIGCGSIKQFDDNIYEVKRVYVNKLYRGKGLSKELMRKLEARAKELGVSRIILETSKTFVEAISLYKSFGYIVIENYGQYKGMELSVCMEKKVQ